MVLNIEQDRARAPVAAAVFFLFRSFAHPVKLTQVSAVLAPSVLHTLQRYILLASLSPRQILSYLPL